MGRERGLRWRPQMLSLLAARCQHEIETILKTLGQDSNLQPQQSETGCGGKTIHRCWHVGDGKNLGKAEARTQTHTGWMVLHSAPMCVCECKEKHHWTYCYNHVGSHLHSTPMCSWGEGTYLQHGQEKPITPGKKSSSNTSVYTSHTRTNNANTKALAPKQFQSLLFLLSVIQRGTSLHSSQDTMALSFISGLMMFPGSIHWGPFNDTWMREGRHVDLPFIENNGANMAPIGSNISQVAVYLSLDLHFPGES